MGAIACCLVGLGLGFVLGFFTSRQCHPTGLLVGHAGMEDPVRTFQALWAGAALPALMRSGVMESRLLLHHLLLHDDSGHAEGGHQRWGCRAVSVGVQTWLFMCKYHADMARQFSLLRCVILWSECISVLLCVAAGGRTMRASQLHRVVCMLRNKAKHSQQQPYARSGMLVVACTVLEHVQWAWRMLPAAPSDLATRVSCHC